MTASIFLFVGGICLLGTITNLIYEGPVLPFLIISIICFFIGIIMESNKSEKEKSELIQENYKLKADAIKHEHSEESYSSYINLKDYPKSQNPNYKTLETYKAVVLFIQRMYIITKKSNGNPYEVHPTQLANLIMNEAKDKLTNDELFIATMNSYISYYFMLDETNLHKNLLEDFNKDLTDEIIFQLRQRFVEEYKESFLRDEEAKIPNIENILTDIFNEKDITTPFV